MKLGKLIKLGIQAGIVWSIADTVKTLVDDATGIITAKPTIKLQKYILRLENELHDNNVKIKEARNAEKKEQTVDTEEDFEDFLQ